MRIPSVFRAVLLASAAVSACAQSHSLDPPVYLPDGSEFRTWVDETSYGKTYWVDQHHPQASDENPGTSNAPFRTIGRAAEIAQAGQRVLIKSGGISQIACVTIL